MTSRLVPMRTSPGPPSGGEALASLALGCPALALAVICAGALAGGPAPAEMTHRARIVTSYQTSLVRSVDEQTGAFLGYESTSVPATIAPSWWYAPDVGYFLFLTAGILLALGGIARRGHRRAVFSWAALFVNLGLWVIGYALALVEMAGGGQATLP